MDGISTITQKGQVAIPKGIRDYFGLKTSDKINFTVVDEKIVAIPVPTVEEMFGSIKTKKILSKLELKKIVRKEVVKKFLTKNASNR